MSTQPEPPPHSRLKSVSNKPSRAKPAKPTVKFDRAFVERRLHEHKLWRERENLRLIEEVLEEAAEALQLRPPAPEILRLRFRGGGPCRPALTPKW